MGTASKETRIKKERQRLLAIFEDMDPNKLTTVRSIIERMAFMTISLEDLEKDLLRDGWTENYQNGENQKGLKKSAAAECHISLTKNLASLTKTLLDIVPPAQRKSKLEEMMGR